MSKLFANQYLFMGQRLRSANCRYIAEMQTDGNFVSYRVNTNGTLSALWWSEANANGQGRPFFAVQQSDGNFVIYNIDQSNWRFAMGTNYHNQFELLFGHFGSGLIQQGDGNLVQYGFDGSVLWASGHTPPPGAPPCLFPPSKTQVVYNTDLPGSNMSGSPFAVTWVAQCGDACARNSACKAWSFTNFNTCWLKNAVPAASGLQGVTSGIIIK